jgi:hypothetical protein
MLFPFQRQSVPYHTDMKSSCKTTQNSESNKNRHTCFQVMGLVSMLQCIIRFLLLNDVSALKEEITVFLIVISIYFIFCIKIGIVLVLHFIYIY